MASMTEERRKEMEEEMNRFELEIAVPGESRSTSSPHPSAVAPNNKPLSPPPPPPAVTALIPEVLSKEPPPPPPPPSSSPPIQAALRPPPPPPVLQAQSQTAPPIRFIPPQLQRQPQRPQARPTGAFIGMRGPPSPFPPPGHMGHFGHPMSGPPMPQVGSMAPGGQMHPGGPMHAGGHMIHMPHGAMPMPPMPHPNMNMSVSLPMPPGFCPPMGPNGNMRFEPQPFTSSNATQGSNIEVSVSSSKNSAESSSVVTSAPTIYSAPFVKSHAENPSENISSSNGKEHVSKTVASPFTPKYEKMPVTRTSESSVGPSVTSVSSSEEIVVSKKKEKKKKIVRMAGGQAWEDNSLLEWESDDFRIFCGDLGNDVTDEVLIRAFSKYSSFVKAKVIRDKRTNKTKGFGFVSFKEPQDFIKAMREMNGRYVGSRPIKLRKSTWRDRNIDIVKKKQREKEKLGLL